MRTFRLRTLALVVVGLAMAACGTNTAGTPTAATTGMTATAPSPVSTSTDPSTGPSTSEAATTTARPTGGLDHLDLGQGLQLSVPFGSATVTPFEHREYDDCKTAQAQVKTATGTFDLALIGQDCPQANQRALNGNHGHYLEPPSHATDVAAAQKVPAGSLVTFGQIYTECTNSCDDYHDAVGLITLAHPQDADLPVLQIVAPRAADGDVATVVALAQSITPTS